MQAVCLAQINKLWSIKAPTAQLLFVAALAAARAHLLLQHYFPFELVLLLLQDEIFFLLHEQNVGEKIAAKLNFMVCDIFIIWGRKFFLVEEWKINVKNYMHRQQQQQQRCREASVNETRIRRRYRKT